LLDIFNLKKDYAGLEKAGEELLNVPGIGNTAAGADIRVVMEKATFKKAQDLETSKNYLGSAEAFEGFARKNANSPLATAAFFNAAINFERAGQNQKSMQGHLKVLSSKDKKADHLKVKSRRILAKLYQDAGMLEEAAKAYRQAAIEAGQDPLAPNFFYNAAIINEALAHPKEALENYQSYFKTSKKADRIEAIFQMAQIHKRSGQVPQAAARFKEYFDLNESSERAVEAAYWVYDYNRQIEKVKDAEIWKKKTLGAQKKLAPGKAGPGAQWAAKIHLNDVTAMFYRMKNIKISGNQSKQKTALQDKILLMNDITLRLGEVIKFNSAEEIVGALLISGRANQHLGEAIEQAPLPAGLNGQEQKTYKEEIHKVAAPFFAKAKDSFRAAYDRSIELEVYGADYKAARELLQKLDAQAVSDHGEIPLDIRIGTWVTQ
jgi:cellulose synthase operon protein C